MLVNAELGFLKRSLIKFNSIMGEAKTVIALLLAFASSQSIAFLIDLSNVWNAYEKLHSGGFAATGSNTQAQSLYGNALAIAKHNIEADLAQHSSWMGLNKWSGLSSEERERILPLVKFNRHNASRNGSGLLFDRRLDHDSTDFDNRKRHLVTSVKDQGPCVSGWAFAGTAALEGQWAKVGNGLRSLSAQNAVDCAAADGCSGADPRSVYWYTIENKGINTDKDYPYVGKQQSCRFKKGKIGALCSSYITLPTADEDALEAGVFNYGPVAVVFNALENAFIHYKKGVYEAQNCSGPVNHVMVVVGFGSCKRHRKRYWILKNSWGTSWGSKGYANVVMGKHACGITESPMIPVI